MKETREQDVAPAAPQLPYLGAATISKKLQINQAAVKRNRRKGNIPVPTTVEFVATLVANPPDWLTKARRTNPGGSIATRKKVRAEVRKQAEAEALAARTPSEIAAANAHQEQLAAERAAQQAEQARHARAAKEAQRLREPQTVREIAHELGLTHTAARDLVLVVNEEERSSGPSNNKEAHPRSSTTKSKTPASLRRQQLDQLLELPSETLAERVASARQQAPILRAQAKTEQERARAARARAVAARKRALEQKNAEQQRLQTLRAKHGIESSRGDPSEVRVVAAAAFLHLSSAQTRAAAKKDLLPSTRREVNSMYGWSEHIFIDLEALLQAQADSPEWLVGARARATAVAERELAAHLFASADADERQRIELDRERQAAEQATAENNRRQHIASTLAINLPVPISERASMPNVTCHLGPTNSGKTYQALQHLLQDGRGVYAAPLRLLAREAYQRLSSEIGSEKVGLLTGEERINEQAPILCATTEMAPLSGHLLVLDEAHWAADPERGSAWGRLLVSGDYQHIHIAAAPDALPLLRNAFPAADVIDHQRLSPLLYVGQQKLQELQPGTAIVAFSRKAVLALAGKLARQQVTVATLYGAMPVEARLQELQRFASGEASVLCTTDVIGHGVNVPTLQTVLFAETEKFDGLQRRDLQHWEIAQIAGRAGRYGLVDGGQVGVLVGTGKWFQAKEKLVRRAMTATVQLGEEMNGHRHITHSYLRPRLADLRCDNATEIGLRLELWCQLAAQKLEQPWLQIDQCSGIRSWCAELERFPVEKMSINDAWQLAHIPADLSNFRTAPDLRALFAQFVACVLGRGEKQAAKLRARLALDHLPHLDLEATERLAAESALVRWFAHSFPQQCPISAEEAAATEHAAAQQVARYLHVRDQGIGQCTDCGKDCPPWFTHCDSCHHQHRSFYDDWNDDY